MLWRWYISSSPGHWITDCLKLFVMRPAQTTNSYCFTQTSAGCLVEKRHRDIIASQWSFCGVDGASASFCCSFWGCQVGGTPGISRWCVYQTLRAQPITSGEEVTHPENVWQSSRIHKKAPTMEMKMWRGRREPFPTTQCPSCHHWRCQGSSGKTDASTSVQTHHWFQPVFSGHWRKVTKTGLGEEPVYCEWEQQQPSCKDVGVSDGFMWGREGI